MQNAAHLDELSKEGERSVREAMKNPLFKEETVRQWSKSMQQWRQLSEKKMPAAASAMQSARQNSGAQPQDMADAQQKADDILKELEQMEGKANQHLDDLQALTLAQRLRKVGGEEKDIGGQLFDSASNTIGLLARDLPEKLKVFERGLIHSQSGAQKQTSTLQSEISRFFERTQKPAYGEVSKEMKDIHAADALDRLGALIEDNIGMEASENLSQWSARFQKWAEKLEPKSSGNSSSSGSSSGQQKNDLTEQLIALLRLRENQYSGPGQRRARQLPGARRHAGGQPGKNGRRLGRHPRKNSRDATQFRVCRHIRHDERSPPRAEAAADQQAGR
jgi:hypothetical protein